MSCLKIDIAVDPCEGTNLVAYGQNGSMAVLAISGEGRLVCGPRLLHEKSWQPRPRPRAKLISTSLPPKT